VLAHLAIDIAGDYLLPLDTYDVLAHGSRAATTLVALLVACTAMWAIGRSALAEVRGSPGALRKTLASALPSSPWRFIAIVAALSAPILLGMGALDASLAGHDLDDIGDLVGGSFLLAGVCDVLVAALVAWVVFRFIGFLCRVHRAIVRAVGQFVRLPRVGAACAAYSASPAAVRPRTLPALLRCTLGNRAPPLVSAYAYLPDVA